MLDTRNIYPLSDFQRNAKDFTAKLKESQKPIVLTVNGKAAIVKIFMSKPDCADSKWQSGDRF